MVLDENLKQYKISCYRETNYIIYIFCLNDLHVSKNKLYESKLYIYI